MARTFRLLFVALLLLQGRGAWAQPVPDSVPTFEGAPESALAQVPANGCVWGNLIYSNGAVIERQLTNRIFFRCAQGSWISFPTLEQATTYGHPAPGPGAGAPR
jgi:hypothetical protein